MVPVQSWPPDTMHERSISFTARPEVATPRILIADDQPDVLEALRLLLKGEGYRIETVTSPAAVLEAVGTGDFDLLLIDLNYTRDTTSGHEGLDLLTRLQQLDATLPQAVITMTGSVGSCARIAVSRSSPSWPDVVSRA